MLASLLPGLRDVRTPLAVGYLWLILAWLVWGDHVPSERPAGDGPLARVFDLSALLGASAVLASVSFVAYVLGAILSIPIEGRLVTVIGYLALFRWLLPSRERSRPSWLSLSGDPPTEAFALRSWGRGGLEERRFVSGVAQRERHMTVERHNVMWRGGSHEALTRARFTSMEDLRPRLLASGKPEVYGEYDRLAAEAAFRINLCLPVLALGIYVGLNLSLWWIPAALVVTGALFYRGVTRFDQSRQTLYQAAAVRVYMHPLVEELHRLKAGEHEQPSPPLSPGETPKGSRLQRAGRGRSRSRRHARHEARDHVRTRVCPQNTGAVRANRHNRGSRDRRHGRRTGWLYETPSPPVRLDQDRRPDPREGQPSNNFKSAAPSRVNLEPGRRRVRW